MEGDLVRGARRERLEDESRGGADGVDDCLLVGHSEVDISVHATAEMESIIILGIFRFVSSNQDGGQRFASSYDPSNLISVFALMPLT